jgi:hypothetical protein
VRARGILAGAITATATGALMAALVAVTGTAVGGTLPAILGLTLPLVAAGCLFGWLRETGRLPTMGVGTFYWAAAYPVARLTLELLVGGRSPASLDGGLAGFLFYQAIMGMAFGVGFQLLYLYALTGVNRALGVPAEQPPASDA